MVWHQFVVEGSGHILEAGELLAFELCLRLREDLRVERHLKLQQVPPDADQLDSLAAARSALRACSLRSHSFRGSAAQVCALAVIALGLPSRAFHRR